MATQHAGRTPVPDDSFDALTPREQEVADLISQGLSNEAIAQQLTLARGTVANHVAHILAKTAARSRVQVAVKLVRPRPSRRVDDVLALLTRLQALGPTDLPGALQHAAEVLSAFFRRRCVRRVRRPSRRGDTGRAGEQLDAARTAAA